MTSGAAAGARAAQPSMQISQTLKRHNPFSSAKLPFVGPDDYHRFSAAGVAAAAADEAIVVKTPQVLQYGSYGNPNSIPSGSRGEFLGRRGGEQQDDLRPVKQAKLREEGLEDFPHRRGSRDDDVPPPVAGDIDQKALKRVFLYFVKAINENPKKKKSYLSGSGPFKCIVCDRTDVCNQALHMCGDEIMS